MRGLWSRPLDLRPVAVVLLTLATALAVMWLPTSGNPPGQLTAVSRAAAIPAPDPPPSLPGRVGALTWNICGAAAKTICKDKNPQRPDLKIKEIVDHLRADSSIAVVMLQESCGMHARLLRKALGDSWKIQHRIGTFIGTMEKIPCDADGGKPEAGITVAMKNFPGTTFKGDGTPGPITEADDGWDMTFLAAGKDVRDGRDDHNQVRGRPDLHTQGAACLQNVTLKLLACASHFPSGDNADYRKISAQDFHDQALRWQRGEYRTIIGGDLNLEHDSDDIQVLYEDNFEADSEHDQTTGLKADADSPFVPGNKIDYIFFSDFGWDLVDGGRVTGSQRYNNEELSDHWMLRGVVRPSADRGPLGDLDPLDDPPAVDAGPDARGSEGSAVSLRGSASDDKGPPKVSWSFVAGSGVDAGTTCRFGDGRQETTTFTCTDDGAFEVILTADDGVNPPVSDSATVHLRNVTPTLRLAEPRSWSVHRVGQQTAVGASFTDPSANDTHTCQVGWDDGRAGEVFPADGNFCGRKHTFADPGMYSTRVVVTDDDGGTDAASVMLVVYDPTAGVATGTGTLESPVGALAGSTHSGTAEFLTVAKYLTTEATSPFGVFSFTLPGTDMRVRATHLEWLVITPNGKAAIKGVGQVGGTDGYGFVAYLQSGRFRTVVWPLSQGESPPSSPLYDNRRGTSYDVDRASPQPFSTGLSLIDSGWVPGVPRLDGELGDAVRNYLQRLPKTLDVQALVVGIGAARTSATAGERADGEPDGNVEQSGNAADSASSPTQEDDASPSDLLRIIGLPTS